MTLLYTFYLHFMRWWDSTRDDFMCILTKSHPGDGILFIKCLRQFVDLYDTQSKSAILKRVHFTSIKSQCISKKISIKPQYQVNSICQQIWETWQWAQDWKSSVFIPIPKKHNVEGCSNYHTIVLISYASKVMLKILQTRCQQYMN